MNFDFILKILVQELEAHPELIQKLIQAGLKALTAHLDKPAA